MYRSFNKVLLFIILTHAGLAFSQSHWEVLPNAPTAIGCFEDIMFITPEVGWLVHSQGRLYKTTDGGATWPLIYQDVGSFFRSVVFTDPLHGWIGSLAGPDLLIQTTDGGLSWSSVLEDHDLPITGICGFSAASDSVVFGIGRFNGNPWLVKTSDLGQTWTVRDLSNYAGTLVDCYFFNPDTGFVVGGTRTGAFPDAINAVVLQTFDGGLNWYERKSTERPGEWCWKISFANRNVGFVSIETNGYNQKTQHILKTTDGGLSWEEIAIRDDFRIQGIGLASANLGWVGGQELTFETMDGGASWLLTDFEWQNINRFQFFGDSLGYAVGKTVYKFYNPKNPTFVSVRMEKPTDHRLLQNYPNPFNPTTSISFNLPDASRVKLSVYTNLGQLIKVLVDEELPAGQYQAVWNGLDVNGNVLASGLYLYQLKTEQFVRTNKMVLMK